LVLVYDVFLIFNILNEGETLSRKEIEESAGFNKSKTIKIINRLLEKNVID